MILKMSFWRGFGVCPECFLCLITSCQPYDEAMDEQWFITSLILIKGGFGVPCLPLKQEPPGSLRFVLALCISCPLSWMFASDLSVLSPLPLPVVGHSPRRNFCLLRGLDRNGHPPGYGYLPSLDPRVKNDCIYWRLSVKVTTPGAGVVPNGIFR